MRVLTIPGMSFLGLSPTAWSALAAIGTFVLAAATVAAVIVTICLARTDRRRDDAKRAADRQRDDELRRQDRQEWERRFDAERRNREDYEARQVLVRSEVAKGEGFNTIITASTPRIFPIKQVDAQVVGWSGSTITVLPTGFGRDPPFIKSERQWFRFRAWFPPELHNAGAIVRFTDRHGNLYYQFRHHTRRFGHNTDWINAAQEIDLWLRTGPNPDEPEDGA